MVISNNWSITNFSSDIKTETLADLCFSGVIKYIFLKGCWSCSENNLKTRNLYV